jgi:hypothetical protein
MVVKNVVGNDVGAPMPGQLAAVTGSALILRLWASTHDC